MRCVFFCIKAVVLALRSFVVTRHKYSEAQVTYLTLPVHSSKHDVEITLQPGRQLALLC